MLFAIEIKGLVQGVGFRPFIYNLAVSMGLKGEVSNNGYGVLVLLESTMEKVDEFVLRIKQNKPSLCEIDSIEISQTTKTKKFKGFNIEKSQSAKILSSKILSDIAMCDECKSELLDKTNRRYGYEFITCVNCGPRYSIIKNLPYDRKNSSMDKFVMCKACKSEYEDPNDRRYHAQPIGCHECGPRLFLYGRDSKEIESKDLIDEVAKAISDGKIAAIKGIGGFHLVCDATNDKAVGMLRNRKKRPSKPFAVMVKDLHSAQQIAFINKKESELLNSNKCPIVLLKKNGSAEISPLVAPNMDQIGIFIAYTPLYYLITERLNRPIVATSANISDEPLCASFDEIIRLSDIWDLCLDHDREIVNSCDDSVLFLENEKTFILRSARGYAPNYMKLPYKTEKKILALGANQKNTIAVTVEDSVILSPYIGDLGTLSSMEHFRSNIDILRRIYDFTPDTIVCDKHPNYESTKYAKETASQSQEIKYVQHHYAHIVATMGINGITSKVLGVSFDGTGYGDDGNFWGGEFFICDNRSYQRVGHFKYFRLIGGERAIKEPRRVALAFLFEIYGDKVFELDNATVGSFCDSEIKTLYTAWKRGVNSPLSSSCGRLFDAVASVLGIVQICSYEGESGLVMESLYDENISEFYSFCIKENEIDFSQIFKQVIFEKDKIAAVSKFFNTIAEIIYEMHKKYHSPVVLGGGVFQNRVLLRVLMRKIPDVVVPEMFVCNDSAIAYGQAIAAL